MKLPGTAPAYHSPWFWGIPAFTLLSMLIIWLTGTNQSVFLFLNKLLYFKPEDIWINITLFGDAAMVMILLLPLLKTRPDIVAKTVIAAFIATLFIHSFKYFLSVPRPPSVFSASEMHQLGNQFAHSSFPSGHATAVFTLAAMVIFMVNDTKIRIALLIYAGLIAISRIATGVHWPMDVLGGSLFGWLAAVITVHVFHRVSGESLTAKIINSLLLIFAAIYLVFIHELGDKEARFMEVFTPIICFILGLGGLKSIYIDPIVNRIKNKAS